MRSPWWFDRRLRTFKLPEPESFFDIEQRD
jgi:hypothetical protein